MEVKENRPDACAASGTANSIYKDFSTDAPDIQEELTGPVLPDECAADIVSFCSEQTIAYDDLLEYATLFYLQDKDPEDPPFRDTLKFELLTLTNRCIDAYNFGKRDPNAAPGAKLKDAYPLMSALRAYSAALPTAGDRDLSAPHGRYAASTASWNKFCEASGRHSVLRKACGRSPVLRGYRRHAGTERL